MAPLQMLLFIRTNTNMHKLKSNHTHSVQAAIPEYMLSAQICMCTPTNRRGTHKCRQNTCTNSKWAHMQMSISLGLCYTMLSRKLQKQILIRYVVMLLQLKPQNTSTAGLRAWFQTKPSAGCWRVKEHGNNLNFTKINKSSELRNAVIVGESN